MEIRTVDHVAMVVSDLDAALETYERLLGATVEVRETLEGQGVEAALLRAGDARLELICPLDTESGVARFLAARGPGLHHLALEVDDVAGALTELERQGARLVDSEPRRGLGGHEVAFVHPESLQGVLVEVVGRG
ncbi:MAG: methylmalonyl-CoA epimerase [Thermoleophilia bacterium]|nr:methylmalonyl-CoA epimerase [Thermoleophilia bacterium]